MINSLPEQILDDKLFIGHVREINFQGSYYMRTVQFENKKSMAAKACGNCRLLRR